MLLYSVKNRMIINNMNSDLFTTTILIKFAFTPFDDYHVLTGIFCTAIYFFCQIYLKKISKGNK